MLLRCLPIAAALLMWPSLEALARPLVLAGGTVIHGYSHAPLRNGVIVIEGERITAVGTVDSVSLPPDAEVISTEGMTVLPGLWDLQVHLDRIGSADEERWREVYLPIVPRVVGPLVARQLLEAGVTSIRAMPTSARAGLGLAERVREKRVDGPTIHATGRALGKLSRFPGEPVFQVTGAQSAAAQVAELARAGASFIVLEQLELWSADELAAAVGEARIRALKVFARGEGSRSVERALEAGVDGFIGMDFGTEPAIPAATLEKIAARARATDKPPLSWTPAVSGVLNYEALRRDPEPLDDPASFAGLPPLMSMDLQASMRYLDRVRWYDMPALRAAGLCPKLRQLQEAGVRLVIGSDSGAPGHLHTRAAWQEVDDWVRNCGIDPMFAIQAATREAAAAMGLEHESGTLSPGKYADIIAVRGDLLRHPALLQRLDIIIRHGRRFR
ncbi:MAG: amidohydrolase family protein [Steroidobacteraceae bacterium]